MSKLVTKFQHTVRTFPSNKQDLEDTYTDIDIRFVHDENNKAILLIADDSNDDDFKIYLYVEHLEKLIDHFTLFHNLVEKAYEYNMQDLEYSIELEDKENDIQYLAVFLYIGGDPTECFLTLDPLDLYFYRQDDIELFLRKLQEYQTLLNISLENQNDSIS